MIGQCRNQAHAAGRRTLYKQHPDFLDIKLRMTSCMYILLLYFIMFYSGKLSYPVGFTFFNVIYPDEDDVITEDDTYVLSFDTWPVICTKLLSMENAENSIEMW